MQTDLYLQCPAEQRGLYAKLARQHTDVDLRAHRRSSEETGREMIPNRLLQKGQSVLAFRDSEYERFAILSVS